MPPHWAQVAKGFLQQGAALELGATELLLEDDETGKLVEEDDDDVGADEAGRDDEEEVLLLLLVDDTFTELELLDAGFPSQLAARCALVVAYTH
jgi:hypothetical protein